MASTFSIQGGRQLEARLIALGRAPDDMLREVGVRAVYEAKQFVHRRTGNLGRTIRLGSRSATHVEVRAGGVNQVGYAAAVEFGSRPHIIVPRNAKVLAWGGNRTLGGRLRKGSQATNFARKVNHPGSKPQPYLIPGFEKALHFVGLDFLIDRWNRAG